MLLLSMAAPGEAQAISKIRDEVRRHLAELGLVVGEEVTVMNTLGGNLILQVKDSRIALDRGLANRIMVRGFANENA